MQFMNFPGKSYLDWKVFTFIKELFAVDDYKLPEFTVNMYIFLCLPDSFWTNPQYRVKIGGLSGVCSETQGDNNMLVSLMQKPDKRNRRLVKSLHIGINIFEVSALLWCTPFVMLHTVVYLNFIPKKHVQIEAKLRASSEDFVSLLLSHKLSCQ